MKKILFLVSLVACGGQTIGDLDGGTDSGSTTDSSTTKSCTKASDCGTGLCGFATADGCSAKGKCFPTPGVMCNGFSPGCACDGSTINITCTGLPDGYVTAPLAHAGQCAVADGGGAFTCVSTVCDPTQDICMITANPTTGTCAPANGCTDCKCAQALFQCVSTCKQNGNEITIQCQ